MKVILSILLALALATSAPGGLRYATYLGGSEEVRVEGFAVRADGVVYLTGHSFGLDFPVTTQPPFPSARGFVAKIDPSIPGRPGLRYSTLIDNGSSTFMDVSPDGLLYFAGQGSARSLTTESALQRSASGTNDAHLMVLDLEREGQEILRYGTVIGGSGTENVKLARLTRQGRIVLAGGTSSRDFPLTENAFDKSCGAGTCSGESGWVAVVDPNISGPGGLVFSSYLDVLPTQMEVDARGRIHLALGTTESGLPVRNAYQPAYRQTGTSRWSDVYYVMIDPSLPAEESLVYGTYLGGDVHDSVSTLAIDSVGRAWLAGSTSSSNFPTTVGVVGAECPSSRPSCEGQGFVASFEPSGVAEASLRFSMRFGGSNSESVWGIAFDPSDRLAIVGTTESNDFPTTSSAFSPTMPPNTGGHGNALFLSLVNPSAGSPLVYSTFLGGSGSEWLSGPGSGSVPHPQLFVDASGRIHFVAITSSLDFPTSAGAFDRSVIESRNPRNRSVFVTIDPSKSGEDSLAYSSFVGPEFTSVHRSVWTNGRFYLGGTTWHPHFPTTPDAIDRTCGFGAVQFDGTCKQNAFVAVIEPEPGPTLQPDRSLVGVGYAVPGPLPESERVQLMTNDADLQIRVRVQNDSEEDWLRVSRTEMTGGGPLEIIADPAKLTAGDYGAHVVLESEEPFLRRSIGVRLVVVWPPPGDLTAVVNAASFLPGPVAPGQLVSIFGHGLGSVGGVAAQAERFRPVLAEIPDVSVSVVGSRNWSASPIFARHDQVNAVVPYGIEEERTVSFSVRTPRGTSLPLKTAVAPSAPGLFTMSGSGRGQAVAVNQDGALNIRDRPAAPGSVLILYGTGEGQTEPAGVTGSLASEPLRRVVLPVSASIGNQPAEVLFAGAAPGFAGLLQVNLRLSAETPPGDAAVWIQVGEARSQPNVTVAIR